jgi:hypothetical protein
VKLIIGRGNSRQVLTMPTAREVREMAKSNAVEHAKIKGNLLALVRRQPKVRMTERAFALLKVKNEAKRGVK